MVPALAASRPAPLLLLATDGGIPGIFFLFVLIAIGAPLVLWYLVRAEAESVETMDRATAERVARQDGGAANETSRDDHSP